MKNNAFCTAAIALAVGGACGLAQAEATFTDKAAFTAATSGLAVAVEDFESVAGVALGAAPVNTALLSLSTSLPGLGVQTGANTPQTGYGTSPADGSHYALVYAPSVAPGLLTFTFTRPVTAFAFTISDVGDSLAPAGALRLSTNTGSYANGVTVLTLGQTLPDGATRFLGLTQDQPFTQVQLSLGGLDEAYGVDQVFLGAAPVPEPASALLLALGGAALLARRARKSLRKSTTRTQPAPLR